MHIHIFGERESDEIRDFTNGRERVYSTHPFDFVWIYSFIFFLFNFLKSRVDRRDVYPELDDFDPFH